MNKTKSSLLLLASVVSCLMFVTPTVIGQKGDTPIRPNGAGVCPFCTPAPPPDCTPAPTPTPRPNSDPRKGIALGPASIMSQDAIHGDQDLRGPMFGSGRPSNISILNDSDTGYVRLWVDWSVLQPYRSNSNFIRVDPNTKRFIESLDAQIVEARRNGLNVILTVFHRYPAWVVWYHGNKSPSGPCTNPCESQKGEARETCEQSAAFKSWKRNQRLTVCERVPRSLDDSSPWAGFISFLVSEYGFSTDKTKPCHPAHNRYVDFLEVVNEPNHTHLTREKHTEGGRLMIALDVADMFVTAQKIVRDQNKILRDDNKLAPGATTIKLAGPATSDSLRRGDDYQEFTEELLRALDRRGFVARSGFVWTHHNYLDVEEQRNCVEGRDCVPIAHCTNYFKEKGRTISPYNSAAWVQKRLADGVGGYRWGGMSDGDGNPAIFLTEGGARLHQLIKIYGCQKVAPPIEEVKRWQAYLVERSFDRMTRGRLSKGILLFTNYLTYTDPAFDSGMFDYATTCAEWNTREKENICTGENGSPRPLFEKWKTLRSP